MLSRSVFKTIMDAPSASLPWRYPFDTHHLAGEGPHRAGREAEVAYRAAEAVEGGDDYHVDPPSLHLPQQAIQAGPLLLFSGPSGRRVPLSRVVVARRLRYARADADHRAIDIGGEPVACHRDVEWLDAEPAHHRLQRGALEAKARRGAGGAADDAASVAQDGEDVFADDAD